MLKENQYDLLNSNLSQISFSFKYPTVYGQTIHIVGNIEELGSWDPSKSIPLATTKETYPLWKSSNEMICPVGMEIYYKYLIKDAQSNFIWETLLDSNQNRHIVINSPGRFIVNDEKDTLVSEIKAVNHHPESISSVSNDTLQLSQGRLSDQTLQPQHINQLMLDLKDVNKSDSDIQELLSYDNNQLNVDDFNEAYMFCKDQKLTSEDRIVITSALLPFQVVKASNGSYKINTTDENLIYLILYGLKEKNVCEVIWVGMLENQFNYTQTEHEEISEFLKENNIHMVDVSECDYKNFWIYIEKIISPVFIESSIDISNEYFLKYEEYFESYQQINRIFGEKIQNIMQTNDLIMINDISLALIPNSLLRKKHHAKIGIYFHICFPSSDVIKTIPYYQEIIKSILLCDVIGFHVFNYARNFLMVLNREFSIYYEIKIKGYITLHYLGRYILVHIMHAGIDLDFINSMLKKKDFNGYLEKYTKIIHNRFAMVSIDNPYELSQLIIKLEAFRLYLRKFPEMKDKCVLIQIITYDKSQEKNLNPLVTETIKEITDEFGSEVLILKEASSIPVQEQLAVFFLSNILFILQMWRGLCTMAHQFIAIQKKGKVFGMIISESVGVSSSIKSAIRVNPFNKKDILKAIEEVFTMDEEERVQKFERDLEFIKENSTFSWIKAFFVDLKRITMNQTSSSKEVMGMGLNFRLIKLSTNFALLSFNNLMTAYTNSKTRLFFLDYEGTLQNIKESDRYSSKRKANDNNDDTNDNDNELLIPSKKVLNVLSLLAKDPNNQVYIVTGREKKYLKKWFKEVKNLGLGAEYGFYYKVPKSDFNQFETLFPIKDWAWKETVLRLLQGFTQKTEGSAIFQKKATISWFYKNCDSYFGHIQANEIKTHLYNILENTKLDIVSGEDYIEIKPKNVNKGCFIAHILQREFAEGRGPDFVFALGDDESDEEMFKYLNSVENQIKTTGKNLKVFSVTVSKKPSSAKYYLNDENEIILYLDSLTHKENQI